MSLSPETIARISDFDSLADFLRDELDWPLDLDADFELLAIEQDATDLGLQPGNLDSLTSDAPHPEQLTLQRPLIEEYTQLKREFGD